ncbi:alanine--tRNA ligase [Patescibacteria group bacterium]|nr:alanine--tRNA ligase [Patescibacteria group bacterium]
MTLDEIRSKYLEFFKARGHAVVPSASLVPENDPTTLFTGSGMQPLVPYLLGKNHPAGNRLADSQKCFRSMDIEEVGDNRHTTFFEMLGNWSLGDYFKKEQLAWCLEFLTKEVGMPKERLWVTCFEGDEALRLPRDIESAAIWKNLGIPEERIHFYGAKKNWWSRSGEPAHMPAGEPGGPDTEVFYEFAKVTHNPAFGPECHPNCDCGRFLEIGNSVFMQYIKNTDGSFGLLPKQNVDFGGGLERIAAAAKNSPDVFSVAYGPIISYLEEKSGKKYLEVSPLDIRAFRIIADHMKAAVFLMADGVNPGNSERGYFVRRLIRRSVLFADKLGIGENAFAHIVGAVAKMYENQYPEVLALADKIAGIIEEEETRFRATLARGLKEFGRFAADGKLTAHDAFQLFTTYGFPLELIVEEAAQMGIKQVDVGGFKELLKKHQELSRAGATQKFKGGLADHSEKTTRLHTAHHLLLKALQMVLGPEVHQRGSNITGERLRIDFSYGQKMTEEQKREVERLVNEKISEDLPVVRTEMPKEEAERLGAEHEFGAKYPEQVSIYSVGPLENAFSIEFCGGPHVAHTGEIAEAGTFKIIKEEAVAQGIRRIKAIVE